MKKSVCFLALSMLIAGCASKQEQPLSQQEDSEVAAQDSDASVDALKVFNEFAAQNEIYFDFDKSEIRKGSIEKPAKLVEKVSELKNINKLVVSGYCDKKGSSEYNKALGMRRAKAVKNALVKNGLDKNINVELISYGESRYKNYVSDIALNDSKNRKVVIVAE